MTTPFYFGWPKFSFAAIISMLIVMLITAVETTGSVYATGEIVGKRIKKDDIPRPCAPMAWPPPSAAC